MEISYDKLPSAGTGWCDGLQWLNEIKSWSKTFEQLRMVPAVTNKQLADSHINILCINVPTSFLEPCKKVVSVILGERLRKAMMYAVYLLYMCEFLYLLGIQLLRARTFYSSTVFWMLGNWDYDILPCHDLSSGESNTYPIAWIQKQADTTQSNICPSLGTLSQHGVAAGVQRHGEPVSLAANYQGTTAISMRRRDGASLSWDFMLLKTKGSKRCITTR